MTRSAFLVVAFVALAGVAGEALPADGKLKSIRARDRVEALLDMLTREEKARRALPDIRRACSDVDGAVRVLAHAVLAKLGIDREEHVRCILKGTADPDVGVRQFAALALGRVGYCTQEVTRSLAKALTDDDRDVQCQAIQSIGRLGPAAKSSGAIARLEQILQQRNAALRVAAHFALARLGEDVESNVAALVKQLKSRDVATRFNASLALGEIGTPARSAIPALVDALRDPHWAVRGSVARSLSEIGSASKEVLAALERALAQEEHKEAANAMRSAAQKLRTLPSPGTNYRAVDPAHRKPGEPSDTVPDC